MDFDASLPLYGKTIVVTRSHGQQGEARFLFERSGARVLDLPALLICPPDEWKALDEALLDLKSFHWIIFSSVNGVNAVDKRLKVIGSPLSSKPKGLKIAAVGKKTSDSLKLIGVTPDFIPPDFIADSLIKHFPVSRSGLKILIPRVQTGGRPFLSKAFTDAGSRVIEVPAYESKCPKDFPLETAGALRNQDVDAIVFTSGKTAAHTAQLIQKFFGEGWENLLMNVKLISIGPQTSISCKKYFNRVDQEALRHDLDGLLEASINLIGSNN